MRYLPTPGRWRRKVVTGLMVVLFLPLLLAVGLQALADVAQIVDHLVEMVWPEAVAALLALLGIYLVRILYFRRRW